MGLCRCPAVHQLTYEAQTEFVKEGIQYRKHHHIDVVQGQLLVRIGKALAALQNLLGTSSALQLEHYLNDTTHTFTTAHPHNLCFRQDSLCVLHQRFHLRNHLHDCLSSRDPCIPASNNIAQNRPQRQQINEIEEPTKESPSTSLSTS